MGDFPCCETTDQSAPATAAQEAEHYIEERIGVYVKLSADGTRWEIETTNFAEGLYGYDDGPVNDNCECSDRAACNETRDKAGLLPMPDGAELLAMLAQYVAEAGVRTGDA